MYAPDRPRGRLPLLGAVLTGGRSRRFGSRKSEARLLGRTLEERAVATLAAVCSDVVVVGPPARAQKRSVPHLPDLFEAAGPLAGVHAALAAAEARGLEGAFVLACDLPLVTPAFVGALAEADDAPVRLASDPGGIPQPLCARWAVAALPAVAAALAAGERSVHGVVDALERTVVPAAHLGAAPHELLNVNTPDDFAAARRALCARPRVVCVVGKKKSGKTTTVVGLVAALRARGVRVMTAKHGHGFVLDTPGTDSWRHAHEGGAARVAVAGPDGMAVMGEWGERGEASLHEIVERFLADADVVVAEGFRSSEAPRIEIHRSAVHARPWTADDAGHAELCIALLSDVARPEGAPPGVPVLDVDDPDRFERLADVVLASGEVVGAERAGVAGSGPPR